MTGVEIVEQSAGASGLANATFIGTDENYCWFDMAHSERRIQTQWDLVDTKLLCEFKLSYKDDFNYTSRPYGPPASR